MPNAPSSRLSPKDLNGEGIVKGRFARARIGKLEQVDDEAALDLLRHGGSEKEFAGAAGAPLSSRLSGKRQEAGDGVQADLWSRQRGVERRLPEVMTKGVPMGLQRAGERKSPFDKTRHARAALAEIGADGVFHDGTRERAVESWKSMVPKRESSGQYGAKDAACERLASGEKHCHNAAAKQRHGNIMPIYALEDVEPELPPEGEYWVAPNAVLIGRVRLLKGASVWWGCVLRGDNDWITVGENSNVQDNSVVHTDPGQPVTIGVELHSRT